MKRTLICLILLGSLAVQAKEAVLYKSSFNRETDTLEKTLTVYHLSSSGIADSVATQGRLFINPPRGPNGSLDVGAFVGDLIVSARVTTFGSDPENINVGLRIGDNNFVYHPGLMGNPNFPDGAFRIEGPGGHGNVSMATQGFIPNRDFQNPARMTIRINSKTGRATIQVADGIDRAMMYQEEFFIVNYLPGSTVIGLTTGSSLGPAEPFGTGAWFDDIKVTAKMP